LSGIEARSQSPLRAKANSQSGAWLWPSEREIAPRPRHVAFLLDHLGGGGGQKLPLMLADALACRGHRVTLLVGEARGALVSQVSERVEVVPLERASQPVARARALLADLRGFPHVLDSQTIVFLPSLVKALRELAPDVLLTARPYMNVEGALALRRAGVGTSLIVAEYNTLSQSTLMSHPLRRRLLPGVLRRVYERAAAVVATSQGVAGDLAALTGLTREQITTIHPPVDADLERLASEPVEHPWLADGEPPLLVAVARLTRAKDIPTLIRAFAHVRAARPARLIVFGDARRPKKTRKRIAELRALAASLGVEQDVLLPGYCDNPLAFMARASVFVLSSITEGFGMVVAQALAVGCPVVSTDCPHGPSEILAGGRFGRLAPVGDAMALGDAILATLADPPDREALKRRGASFSLDNAVDRYEMLIQRSCSAVAARDVAAG
jgi:glycosyltransferase involved in cell wall biosynthesis